MLTRKQRDDWAKALRSGEYVQMQGAFIDTDKDLVTQEKTITKHCCLAVLACTLGQPKDSLLGINYPTVISSEERNLFVRLNDDNRYSFEQIADEVDKLPVSGK